MDFFLQGQTCPSSLRNTKLSSFNMTFWVPVKCFEGEDVYLIGGGPSLRTFDWNLLKGKRVIGCNSAFRLGIEICPICFFSDRGWYLAFKQELENYKGILITNAECLVNEQTSLKVCQRAAAGLYTNCIGFNYSSGAGAINLALCMGAKRVFLLGYDCGRFSSTQPNWHDYVIEKTSDEVYTNFIEGFTLISNSLQHTFPGTEIINLTELDKLLVFPRMSPITHFITEKSNDK